MYVLAGTFALTFVFNVWHEVFGPAGAGFNLRSSAGPYATSLAVSEIVPGGPFGKAGVREGDVIEGANGYAINTALDWYIVRGNFELQRPIELRVRRGDQHLQLQFTLSPKDWNVIRFGEFWPELAFRIAQFNLAFRDSSWTTQIRFVEHLKSLLDSENGR